MRYFLLIPIFAAFAQPNPTYVDGTYINNETRQLIIIDTEEDGDVSVFYWGGEKPIELEHGLPKADEYGENWTLPIWLFEQKCKLTIETVGEQDLRMQCAEGDNTYYALVLNQADTTDLHPWKFGANNMPGTYMDHKSGEMLMLRPEGKTMAVYYSNGKKPFSKMITTELDKRYLEVKAAFSGSPNTVYKMWYNFSWMGQIKLTNPDGSIQYFGGMGDYRDPAMSPQEIKDMHEGEGLGKPVTYLYPEHAQKVQVTLSDNIRLKASYPPYPVNGWSVTALPDGRLLDDKGDEYSYLFWDTYPMANVWDMTSGTVVTREDVLPYLQRTLTDMNLTPKERNEFIVYWMPLLQQYSHVHINWAVYYTQDGDNHSNLNGDKLQQLAGVTISPSPRTIYRVMLLYRPVDGPRELSEPQLPALNRQGFTVVEWGGTRLANEVSENRGE